MYGLPETPGAPHPSASFPALRSVEVQCRVFHPAGVRAAYLAHNDPHGEHDFGSFEVGGRKFF
jgi:hypothetical protein